MDVIYVDEQDRVIGSGSIANAVNNGIRVRIARVFIFNKHGKLLLQKRSENHKSLPGRWDHSAAGHVDAGESYLEAAQRELVEEMGIKGVALTEFVKYYAEEKDETKVKRRFSMLYVGKFDGKVHIDEHEVSDFRWISLDNLRGEMSNSPREFTQGFINAFGQYQNKTRNT